jgi:hypothetical protein
VHEAANDRPRHDGHVRCVLMGAIVRPGPADLDLDAVHVGRHRDDQRADVVTDVEEDGSLPGEGVLVVHQTFGVPGRV